MGKNGFSLNIFWKVSAEEKTHARTRTHRHALTHTRLTLTHILCPPLPFQPHPLTHTTFNWAVLHTCGCCASQWSHISFIKIYFPGTVFGVQPVSIRSQVPGPDSTWLLYHTEEVQGVWDRCWNLHTESSQDSGHKTRSPSVLYPVAEVLSTHCSGQQHHREALCFVLSLTHYFTDL